MFSKHCESEAVLVTIRQVAQEAGVSTGTVSRVLNHKPGVSETTRHHVLTVARELGYTLPRRSHLSTAIVTHLGLLNRPMEESLPANAFYADVLNGIEQLCHASRINLSYSSLDIVNGHLRSLPALAGDERISGLILVGAISQAVIETIVDAMHLPIVLVDNWLPHCCWDAVMTDNVRGVSQETEFLMSQGHRHIALIGGPDHPSIVERRAGYQATLQEHGLAPIIVESAGLEMANGEQAVVELLRRAPETTAIVCSNDLQAIGALRKLQELGYQVPTDFSVVGFDDINLARLTSPPLTTIRVGRQALGQVATHLLLGRISASERPAVKAVVGVTLVERDSVGAPRASAMPPLGGTPSSTKRWFKAQETVLFQGHALRIVQQLEKAACDRPPDVAEELCQEAGYFRHNERRMNYLEVREEGWPIGSGMVESGGKQFKARFAGSGMRWSRVGAERLIPVRAAIMSRRFDELWARAYNSPQN